MLSAILMFHPGLVAQKKAHTEEDKKVLAEKAQNILGTHCGKCHGRGGSYSDEMSVDRDSLLRKGFIDLGSPGNSELYTIIQTGDMPPKAERKKLPGERFPETELQTIKEWIEAGAPDWGCSHDPEKPPKITHQQMLKWMRDDLMNVDEVAPEDRSLTRYFTLSNLFNNECVTDDDLQNYRTAFSKLINSLSWGSEIVEPTPVKGDKDKTIFRINLEHFQWDEDIWEDLTIRQQDYPYPYIVEYPDQEFLQELKKETHTDVPFIRADWFIANAAKPELYHLLLQLPETDAELETEKLSIRNIKNNIKNGRAMRSGFLTSGVSKFNRIVERHANGVKNYYWKSYDFSSNKEEQNIFQQPIGPANVFPDQETFKHAGGEMIFGLPNGLQGYFLTDEKGNRIDRAPIEIVRNLNNGPGIDPVVSNGLSCMTCHTKGIISFDAKAGHLRGAIEKSKENFVVRNFKKEEALGLYKEAKKINDLVKKDIERFEKAVKETGGVIGNQEPIALLANLYEGPLDATSAACEIGVTVNFLKRSINECKQLQEYGLQALLVEDGPGYAREAWEDHYQVIYKITRENDDHCDPDRPDFPIELFAFNSDRTPVQALAWDPNQGRKNIYSSGRNASIIKWNAFGSWEPTGENTGDDKDNPPFFRSEEKRNDISKIAFNPSDHNKMAVLSRMGGSKGKKILEIFDLRKESDAPSQIKAKVIEDGKEILLDIENFEWSPDGKLISIINQRKQLTIHNSITGEELENIRDIMLRSPALIDWSPCGEMLVFIANTIGGNSAIEIWDSELKGNNGKPLYSISEVATEDVHSLDWGNTPKLTNQNEEFVSTIAIGYTGNHVDIIHVGRLEDKNNSKNVEIDIINSKDPDRKKGSIFPVHSKIVNDDFRNEPNVVVSWSLDGRFLATGSNRDPRFDYPRIAGEIKIWSANNLQNGSELETIPIPPIVFKVNGKDYTRNNHVSSLSWSPKQDMIAAGLLDGRVLVFERKK